MKQPLKDYLPYMFVATAAILWGGIGIFIEVLDASGFTPLQIVALRVSSATVMLFGYLLIRSPHLLKIRVRDTLYFIGTGVISISFFNWCYFTAIKEVSLSIAVILLYTGPAFVVVMARMFFGEPFTTRKLASLLLTLLGCVLVVGLIPIRLAGFSWYGILVGLGAGFGYALYSIFGKTALKRYPTVTILFYTFLVSSLVMLPLSGLLQPDKLVVMGETSILSWIIGLGFFPTVLAYMLYTEGLSRIEAGKASITTMLEPVTAALIGVTVFNETLSLVQVSGMVLVLLSVLILQLPRPLSRLSGFRSK